ncbi:phosphonate metabolism protein/1,5-bisphosphokinase (PRPP-forming) PhnN [Roseiarcaceae bacterium H3SJ34-1]|uniref:phosphonate metabolism protein/1,5-bisphosphokinase (PRPP-forming) PhnN n=1 Tax=Terripilifer ovatus TaxID=3032367 RepID=UPI003AB93896|nr:phosphonate metabolism protein/1,5-bisphosphokinase (PRPP-forming) PhnN [Roseiarcaceae bacterium H3SJ34-1]
MLETSQDGREAPATTATQGTLIIVIGPSGAGKDSLINYARARLASDPAVLFVRRTVTRTADAATEDHESLTQEEFAAAAAEGRFAVVWEAHGLRYGIPAGARAHIEAGGVAVANGSRAALPAILARFGKVTVVHVNARPDVLASRLAMRGREDAATIQARLERKPEDTPSCDRWIEIDNSGELAVAGERLLAVIGGFYHCEKAPGSGVKAHP